MKYPTHLYICRFSEIGETRRFDAEPTSRCRNLMKNGECNIDNRKCKKIKYCKDRLIDE